MGEELLVDFEADIAPVFGTSRGKRMELVEQMLREEAKGSDGHLGLQGGVCGKGVLMTDGDVARKIAARCGGKGLHSGFSSPPFRGRPSRLGLSQVDLYIYFKKTT